MAAPPVPDLPASLRPFFWDVDFDALSWLEHRDFIAMRVLVEGSWQAVCWLRERLGDGGVRDLLYGKQAKGLSPRQLRFWQIALDLPDEIVGEWVRRAKAGTWDNRLLH